MVKNILLAFCLFLAISTSFVVQAADEGKCAESTQFKCPNAEACPNSGYSLVEDCFDDCEGFRNTDGAEEQCFDRKIFDKNEGLLWFDIGGMIVWFFAAGVATACGVGGGGIYVPLGMVLMRFAPKAASGLSQCSIFGASLGGLLLNLRNLHPYSSKIEQTGDVAGGNGSPETERVEADIPTNEEGEPNTNTTKYFTRPLIDYDMALFLAPMEMAGAVLGKIIQNVLPNWLYLFLAAIILGFTARKTYLKWWSTRAKEMAKENAVETDAAPQEQGATNTTNDGENPNPSAITTTEEIVTSPSHSKTDIEVKADIPDGVTNEEGESASDPDDGLVDSQNGEEVVMDAEKIKKRLWFLERDARQYPVEKLVALAILWIGLTLLTFLLGGKGVKSWVGINCESPWYGVLIGFQFLWTFGFAAFFAVRLMRESTEKQSVAYPFNAQDVLWDFQKTRFYSFFTFVAGIVAGLIGIGGGMVLGPLMLVMGIYPRVSTATTATMIVLTSSGVAISYVTAGLVPWEYAITYFCTCFVGALIGKTKIDGYVKKTGKGSILIFLLATIIALATLGSFIIALLNLNRDNWCFTWFKPFCKIDDGSSEVTCMPGEEERFLGSAFYGDVVRGGL